MSQDRIIIIPEKILESYQNHPILSQLMVTHCGFYYEAHGHFIERSGTGEYILIYCIAGKGWLTIHNNTQPINKGDVLIIPSNTPHAYGADAENPWSIHWIHFRGASAGLLVHYPFFTVGDQPRLIHYFTNLYLLFTFNYLETHMLKASAYLQLLLCELKDLAVASFQKNKDFTDIEKVVSLMRNNLQINYSLDELAQSINLSKYHFIRKFKDYTSYTPIEYLNHLKIQYACDLLIQTHWTIGEISKYLGFNNPYYFSEHFKQITGYPPSQLRKIIKNKL